MNEETKKKYIDVINELDVADSLITPIIVFIETYDGTNEVEFMSLLSHMVSMICAIRELSVKADGYDALEDNFSDFTVSMNDLKEKYNTLMEGKIPLDMPFSSMSEVDTDEE